jgi:uncharacterized membrane protein
VNGRWVASGAFAALTGAWIILMLRQVPCLGAESYDTYRLMCYTDIPLIYNWRQLVEGQVPLFEAPVEYPVLTALFMEIARRLVPLFGGLSEPGLSEAQIEQSTQLFFGITAVMLFGCMLVAVWAHLQLQPRDAWMLAASPAVITCGLINWDALVVALTALALLAWSRGKPVASGVFIGLGVAAKLYPALLLVPLAALCLRAGRMREFGRTVAAACGAWALVNLPFAIANPANWALFWSFNEAHGADLGSIWLVLEQMGQAAPNLSRAEFVLLALGTAGIVGVLLAAPKRPRLAQGVFLIVTLFAVVNKVYSPQYVLWLLPLLILANPRRGDWLLFTFAETLYFASVWLYFVAALDGTEYRFYWFAIAFRVGVQLWLSGRVVYDIFHPPAWDPETNEGILRGSADVVAYPLTRYREHPKKVLTVEPGTSARWSQ